MDEPADDELKLVDGAEIVRRCPNCHAHFVRDGGCEHMTCRCGHRFRTRGVSNWRPGRHDLSPGFVVGVLTLLLLGALLPEVKRTSEVVSCEPEYARLLQAAQCLPCHHELQLLNAKREDLVYCNATDTSSEMIRLIHESALAALRYDFEKDSCDLCVKTCTKAAKDFLRMCEWEVRVSVPPFVRLLTIVGLAITLPVFMYLLARVQNPDLLQHIRQSRENPIRWIVAVLDACAAFWLRPATGLLRDLFGVR